MGDVDPKGCRVALFRDADGDGYGNVKKTRLSCRPIPGYVPVAGDCDDRDANRFPSAPEICDGIDQNCNHQIDEGAIDRPSWFVDADGDGHGDPSSAVQSCTQPAGYVAAGDDCDDQRGDVFPGAAEACDGVDNDCDHALDEGAMYGTVAAYPDADGDGYGLATATPTWVCDLPPGFASQDGDCDDNNVAVHPYQPERCNQTDDDCDGVVDNDSVDAVIWYLDDDGDGHGDALQPTVSCAPVGDVVPNSDDCDDANAAIFPGNVEFCDGVDTDCDGNADNNPADGRTYYADADADGFGDLNAPVITCDLPPGYSLNTLDCDDGNARLPYYIDQWGSSVGSGTLFDPGLSVQTAVDSGASCILLGSGVFQEDLDLSQFSGVIESINGSSYTTLEGLGDGPAIVGSGVNATLKGLTITGAGPRAWQFVEETSGECAGTQDNLGGGIAVDSSTLVLEDLILQGNDVRSTPSSRSECYNFAASAGGAIYADTSTLTMDNVLMTDNAADQGAAMMLVDSQVQVRRLRVTGAPAGYASDIEIDGGTFEATNMVLSGPADIGIHSNASTPSITQSLIAAYETGWSATDNPTIQNSVFLDNIVGMDGPGTWTVSYTDSDNGSQNWPAVIAGVGNLSVDPLFTAWDNDGNALADDYSLQGSSPLIDAGDPAVKDADGSPSDIGPMGGPDGF